jgi:penicillin-binding protein 1C
VEGNLLAIDPDIPADRQRVMFIARGAEAAFEWQLDGQPLEAKGTRIPWEPKLGHHVLTLHALDGHQVDAVRFEVRGSEAVQALAN